MSAIEDRMAALAAKFVAGLPETSLVIEAALEAGNREVLVERAHKLAGIAGMMGHPAIGAAALALEECALAGADAGPAAATLLELLDEAATRRGAAAS